MSKKINSIGDLLSIVMNRYSELDDIPQEYLSEAGHAAREAYRVVLWYTGFHDSLESLLADESFTSLVSISGKHPEYYRILRMINRVIEKSSRKE